MNQPNILPSGPSMEMPDIAKNPLSALQTDLDWVGMSEVHQAVRVMDGNRLVNTNAKTQLFVNLQESNTRGIHMSRLFLLLDELTTNHPLTPMQLKQLCARMLDSHDGLSSNALVKFKFEHGIYRKALISDNYGWIFYPVTIQATQTGTEWTLELSVEVLYSSACPCSAALSRQLIQEGFDKNFAGQGTLQPDDVRAWLGTSEGIVAVPHSQRSSAHALVKLVDSSADGFPITKMVNQLEAALQTPVQTAVKREDEREFARLNGQNLMFCEDAARRLKAALAEEDAYLDFRVRVSHMESLHAHDAVAITTKGVPDGYSSMM